MQRFQISTCTSWESEWLYNPPTLAKTRNYCSWLYSSFLYRAQALKIVMNGLNVVRVSVELHVE